MEAKKTAPSAAPAGARPPAKPKVVIEAYSFRRQGWPYIRKSATVFGICLLLAISMVVAVQMVLIKTRPRTADALQKKSAANERLNEAELERIEIRDFKARFDQLRVEGFFGDENRLAMLEAIGDIQKQRQMMPINYDFAPQQVVAIDPALMGAELHVHSSAVHLKMDLLHEMDLVHFLQDLRQRGTFAVKDCTLLGGTMQPGTVARPLSADCTLFWITVGKPAGAVPPPEGAAQ